MNNSIKKAIMPIPSSIPNTGEEVHIGGKTILSLRAKWGPLFEGQQRSSSSRLAYELALGLTLLFIRGDHLKRLVFGL